MGPIKGVLREELSSSTRMMKGYERELAKLPKGSLVKKTIKGHEYYYLIVRTGKKIRFIYKGKVSAAELKKYEEIKRYRAKYRKLLSQTKKQVRFLKSSLRGKESI